MRNLSFWKSDWFLGLGVALILLIASSSDLLQSLERKAYDIGVRATSRTPSDKIAVIAIDDQSISNIGRWPWSRDVHVRMTELLTRANAKVIGNTVFFFEPQLDPGLTYINKLTQAFAELKAQAPDLPAIAHVDQLLGEAEQNLNTDQKLAESFRKAGNIVLPMVFQALTEPQGNPDKPLPEPVAASALARVDDRGVEADRLPLPAILPLYPLTELAQAASALGHLNSDPDVDGGIRTEPMILRYYEQYFPSMSVMVAARSLNLTRADVRVRLGEEVSVGKLHIRTDPQLRMLSFFYSDRDGKPAFAVDSFFDVYSGKIPAEKYRDKIVLIGATAVGVGQAQVTPVSPAMSPVLTMAHSVSSILNEDFFVQPYWAGYLKLGIYLLIAVYLIALLPRLSAAMGAIVTTVLFVTLLATHFVLMTTQLTWIPLMSSVTLLVVGHLLLTTKRYLITEKSKVRSDVDLAQSHRMLGLGYQGQGQLDTAFDYFRKLPPDDSVLDLLYNLALDFERKRQFNKAESVFRYVVDHNPKFRDVADRVGRAKAMSDTVILGSGSRTGTVILAGGGVEKPMLGRYQVEKELGKGAMGVVYQGKDPKIGRIVAIKTMALAQEFEADELQDVKERFFREAETAGRLNHPYIVTIFDAGEEHDLAYIAMEFLKGKDLTPYVKPGTLLPLNTVISIVARVAEALSYAHANNVVHRDVKPANVMYELESDTVKVTDFGIARITDSSKTKTGMVLGTPSYMSPEQLAGRKIEGRSDIFSLGVTLYQLLSGHLPFHGDSMAQLMFKIANEPAFDILVYNAVLPQCVVDIVNKALAKRPEERYQSGGEMAKALRACLAESGEAMSQSEIIDIGL